MGFIILVIIFAFVFGSLAGHVAGSKGCDSGSWSVIGFLFGPIGLIAACGLPDRRLHGYLKSIALAVGVQEDSLPDAGSIARAVGSTAPPHVHVRDDEVFQFAGSPPESIWESLLMQLPAEIRVAADPGSSEYRRTKIKVRDSQRIILATFVLSRAVQQGSFWRLARTFPHSR